MAEEFYVKAIWDPEAGVWCSESNIVGLVLETATLGEFEALMRNLAPELLTENMAIRGSIPIRFEATAEFQTLAA